MDIPAVLKSDPQHPPSQAMYVKLNSNLLQAVLEGKYKLSLVVADEVNVQVNDALYKATFNQEASHVDIYKGQGKQFMDVGRLSHRVLMQNVASKTDISSEDRMLVMHVLAIQPISIRALVQRTKLDLAKVEKLAKDFGMVSDAKEKTYSLNKPAYACINLNWKGYSDQERLLVQLGTKTWLTTLRSKPATKRPTTPPVAAPAQSGVKRPLKDEDMLELARKFKHHYTEYAKLYTTVSSHPSQDQVQRLLILHKKLALWKQRIWAHTAKVPPRVSSRPASANKVKQTS